MFEVRIVQMTPEWAKDLLARNRPVVLVLRNLAMFREILRRGEWRLTPDAIHVDSEGLVRNGQHRLKCISEMPEGSAYPLILLEGGGLLKETEEES